MSVNKFQNALVGAFIGQTLIETFRSTCS